MRKSGIKSGSRQGSGQESDLAPSGLLDLEGRDQSVSKAEEYIEIDALKFPVVDWKPNLGAYFDVVYPRMLKSVPTTREVLLERLRAPDHEFSFQKQGNVEDWKHPIHPHRMVSHTFGDRVLFTIWNDGVYVYHATVEILNGMELVEAAFTIYCRWVETRPLNPFFQSKYGISKTRKPN